MKLRPDRSQSARALAWMAFGGTVAGVAFSLHPVSASPVVYWVLLAVGAGATALGLVAFAQALRGGAPGRPRDQAGLLAADCRRVQHQVALLISDCASRQPRGPRTSRGDARLERWRAETLERYRLELRAWATKVFEDAVAAGAAPRSARALVDAPSATQLPALRDLFRDAADRLDARGHADAL